MVNIFLQLLLKMNAKGNKYTIKKLVVENSLNDKKNLDLDNEPTIVDKLFDLVGEDVVEFK